MYDLVIIGTSPGAILESVVARRRGKKVCLVDRRTVEGGAWFVTGVLGATEVEAGPHFFQSRPDLEFLRDSIDFDLVKVPRTTWILDIRGITLRLHDRAAKLLVNLIQVARFMLHGTRMRFRDVSDDRASAAKDALSQIWWHILHYREATMYFDGGCARFLDGAVRLAQSEGVDRRSEDITEVECTDAGVRMKCRSGVVIECRELAITVRTTFARVRTEESDWVPEIVPVHRNQVHLLVTTDGDMDFYLYRFAGIGYFAVVNLTRIGNHRGRPGEYLLCVTLADMRTAEEVDREAANRILETLIGLRVCPDDAMLTGYASSVYDDSRMSQADYGRLVDGSGGRIRCAGDVDFSVWVAHLSRRWRNAEAAI